MIIPQVFAFTPQHIESVEPGLPAAKQQVFELGLAVAVEGNDFAVENR
jgi:hypothetical protein